MFIIIKSFQDSYSSSGIFRRHFHFLKSVSNNISCLTYRGVLKNTCRLDTSSNDTSSYSKNLLKNDVRLQEYFLSWTVLQRVRLISKNSFDDKFPSWKIFTWIISVLRSLSDVNFRLPKELSRRRSSSKRIFKTNSCNLKTYQERK